MSEELSDAIHDEAYCRGFKAGWNAGVSDDEKAFRSVSRGGEDARKFIRQSLKSSQNRASKIVKCWPEWMRKITLTKGSKS